MYIRGSVKVVANLVHPFGNLSDKNYLNKLVCRVAVNDVKVTRCLTGYISWFLDILNLTENVVIDLFYNLDLFSFLRSYKSLRVYISIVRRVNVDANNKTKSF